MISNNFFCTNFSSFYKWNFFVIPTDGSFGEIPRNNYVEAEERVVSELKEIGKPFIVVLNSSHPMLPETERLAEKLHDDYGVPVLPISFNSDTTLSSAST